MPKMKSKKGAVKRFKVSATGKVVCRKSNSSHILTKKTSKRKRGFRQSSTIKGGNEKRIKQII